MLRLSSSPFPYFLLSLSPNSLALCRVPRKHMRDGAVLMRTEWPRRHRGSPPQILRRYQFSGVFSKGIPNTLVLCYTMPSQIPPKAPSMPSFCCCITEMLIRLFLSSCKLLKCLLPWICGEMADSSMPSSFIPLWVTRLTFNEMVLMLLFIVLTTVTYESNHSENAGHDRYLAAC